MDVANLNSWVLQPDVCRCCLSASGNWDLTASYITEAGIKEVFMNMLLECYGISLSYLTEWGPSHMLCAICARHLRHAADFKKQILQAERHFTEYYDCKKDGDQEMAIKTEPELDDHSPEDYTEDRESNEADGDQEMAIKTEPELDDHSPDDYSDDREPNEADSNIPRTEEKIQLIKSPRRKRHKHVKGKTKVKEKEDIEDDSDTPISELKVSQFEEKSEQEKSLKLRNDKLDIPKIGNRPVKINATKQISERKRVILTCSAVLQDTTACPFRHHKSWFQCFFCHQDFMQLTALRAHTNETHADVESELKKMKRYPRSLQIDISNLECRHCNLNLTDVDAMRRHFVDVHEKVIYRECIADYKVDSSPYTCHLCEREFHVFRTLTTHLNEHYANCICDICGKSFLNSKRLKVHKRTHESGLFPCSECGKILKTKTSKANHMESAHSKRVIKCHICSKPMKHYNDRVKHMSEVHNIRHTFKCPICGREYNIKHYLATHIRQTHGHKNKKCVECGMAFITNHGLKKHMLKHTGEKPFSCTVCCKAYARSYTLREHMRAHESDRRFLCPE